jgi:FkbM family methyltransferase
VDEQLLRGQEGGFFVEVGAHDGTTFSNTLFFEAERNWTGLCIEPIPEAFGKLRASRRCTCIRAAVSTSAGTASLLHVPGKFEQFSVLERHASGFQQNALERELAHAWEDAEEITVECQRLSDLLAQSHPGVKTVDFCSIDTEGAELDVLRSIDFGRHDFRVFAIEENGHRKDLLEHLTPRGFLHVESIGVDMIFVNAELARLAGRVGLQTPLSRESRIATWMWRRSRVRLGAWRRAAQRALGV